MVSSNDRWSATFASDRDDVVKVLELARDAKLSRARGRRDQEVRCHRKADAFNAAIDVLMDAWDEGTET